MESWTHDGIGCAGISAAGKLRLRIQPPVSCETFEVAEPGLATPLPGEGGSGLGDHPHAEPRRDCDHDHLKREPDDGPRHLGKDHERVEGERH